MSAGRIIRCGRRRHAARLVRLVAVRPTGKQVYAVFRKTFELKEKPKTATLRLFANSPYILWINGKYVDRGPCRFDPKGPEYDTLDVARLLQAGPNIVAIAVHSFHDGADSSNVALFCGRIMGPRQA